MVYASSPPLSPPLLPPRESCFRQGKRKGGIEGLSLDVFHIDLIYYICTKVFCLSHLRGFEHQGCWTELRGDSVSLPLERPFYILTQK